MTGHEAHVVSKALIISRLTLEYDIDRQAFFLVPTTYLLVGNSKHMIMQELNTSHGLRIDRFRAIIKHAEPGTY